MIRDGRELAAARIEAGLSLYELADYVRLGGTTEKGAQRLRFIEQGKIALSGPLAVAAQAICSGWRDSE